MKPNSDAECCFSLEAVNNLIAVNLPIKLKPHENWIGIDDDGEAYTYEDKPYHDGSKYRSADGDTTSRYLFTIDMKLNALKDFPQLFYVARPPEQPLSILDLAKPLEK